MPLASRAASAADRVSPAPVNTASSRSYFSLVSTDCGEASTLSMNWSGSTRPVTSV
ncbi:Uncharacterised protein [Mycobacterium tuberculosis]|nr:Uncharacterised protein [Mycobacterium tuberculosis]